MHREVQPRFGSDLYLLSVSGGLNGCAATGTYTGTDGCALSASGQSANQRAQGCAATNHRGGPLASRTSLLLYIAGLE